MDSLWLVSVLYETATFPRCEGADVDVDVPFPDVEDELYFSTMHSNSVDFHTFVFVPPALFYF